MLDKVLRSLGITGKDKKTVGVIVCVSLFLLLLCYMNNQKSNSFDFYNGDSKPQIVSGGAEPSSAPVGADEDSLANDEDLEGSPVPPGSMTDTHGLPSSGRQVDTMNAEELLPSNSSASQWSESNRDPSGILKNVNLLPSGSMIGINTVGQTLRNANLQVRAEPPNPQMNIGPWNQSTIEPDSNSGFKVC